MATMICQMCGKEVERTSNVQKYCEECRIRKQSERNNSYKKRKEDGVANIVGATAICQECGKEFVRNTGNQKLCTECSQKGAASKKKFSEMTQEQRHEEYVKNTQIQNKLYDRLSIYIPKGKKTDLQELSKVFGISLNTFVNQAIESYEEQIRSEINKDHPSSD
mgnify:CR=1 FL=1